MLKNGPSDHYHMSLEFEFSFDLIRVYFGSKVFVIGLFMFPNHWHNSIWPWLKICKNGHSLI
jgi:hypothetical protein